MPKLSEVTKIWYIKQKINTDTKSYINTLTLFLTNLTGIKISLQTQQPITPATKKIKKRENPLIIIPF